MAMSSSGASVLVFSPKSEAIAEVGDSVSLVKLLKLIEVEKIINCLK